MEPTGTGTGTTYSSSKIVEVIANDSDAWGHYETEEEFDAFVNKYADQINSGEMRAYFFGGGEDGSMKTGKQTIGLDGEDFAFEFEKSGAVKGAGKNGLIEKDDKLYMAGKLVKADKDDKYTVYAVVPAKNSSNKVIEMDIEEYLSFCNTTTDGLSKSQIEDGDMKWIIDRTKVDAVDSEFKNAKFYLVNSAGKVIKDKSSAKDGNDYKFEVKNREIKSVILEG